MEPTIKRRTFIETASLALAAAPSGVGQRKAGEPIGIAVIGVGNRGFFLLKEFQDLEGAEIRVICDLYDGNLKRAKGVRPGSGGKRVGRTPDRSILSRWGNS